MKKWKDTSLSSEERVRLAEEKRAEEKVKQMMYETFLTARHSVEKNNRFKELLYRDVKADFSIIFPKTIGVAATFNVKLINEVLRAVSDDDRTKEQALNNQIAKESIVLLKNNKLLPLSRDDVNKIAFIQLDTDNKYVFMRNHSNTSSGYTGILDGLKKTHERVKIVCPFEGVILNDLIDKEDFIQEAVAATKEADLVILAVGLSNEHDGEINSEDKIDTETDKTNMNSSKINQGLIEAVCNDSTPAILLNFSDSWMDLSKAGELCEAIFQCWNPEQIVGEVVAKMIFGDYKPCGKLPVTFYNCMGNSDYSAGNDGNSELISLYPFGYGLTYSFVEYYRIYLSEPKIKVGEDITVTIFLKNKGKYETKDVVQVYLVDEESTEKVPAYRLAAFKKVILPVEEEIRVCLTIKSREMALINKKGESIVEPGRFSLYVGGGQPDDITAKLYNRDCLHIGFLVE